jgi:hypothetical protein
MLNINNIHIRKCVFIICLLTILGFSACKDEPDENSGEKTNPAPVDTQDGKTYLKINNTTEYAVNVYINDPPLYSLVPDTIWRVEKRNTAQRELQSGEVVLYFEYLIPVGSTIIPYYSKNTTHVKKPILEKGKGTTQDVPALGSAQTDSAFVLIRNTSGDAIWLQQGIYTRNPYGALVREILPHSDAIYVFDNVNSLNNCTIGDITRRNLPNISLENGKIYTFIYDGESDPGLFLVEHFDPSMAKNIWNIPFSSQENRYLTTGFFAPRAEPANGYLLLGNINAKSEPQYLYNGYVKSSPYFAHITRDGNVTERIIPFANPANQNLITSFVEDAGKYVFLGQQYHNGNNKPFVMSIGTNFAPGFYYDGFNSDIDTDTEYMDAFYSTGKIVLIQNGKYGVLFGITDKNTWRNNAYLAIVTQSSFDRAAHQELWRSPDSEDAIYIDMIYDKENNRFLVLVQVWEPDNTHLKIYAINADATTASPVEFIHSFDKKYQYTKILKVGNGYYLCGSYKNVLGKYEGILDKLNLGTGTSEWNEPVRFPSVDNMGNAKIWNIFEDNGRIILSGMSNATYADDSHDYQNGKPWICAFDIATSRKIWEQCYTDPKYHNYIVYSSYSNGIGSYILELYSRVVKTSVLISTDLMGRPAGEDKNPLPYQPREILMDVVQEFANVVNINAEITPLTDVSVTPPVLQLSKGQSGTFTVNSTYSSYVWYLDGILQSSNSTRNYTLQTGSLDCGVYTVTVVVTTSTSERRSGSYTVRITN